MEYHRWRRMTVDEPGIGTNLEQWDVVNGQQIFTIHNFRERLEPVDDLFVLCPNDFTTVPSGCRELRQASCGIKHSTVIIWKRYSLIARPILNRSLRAGDTKHPLLLQTRNSGVE
jgi:hypothetical protein